MRARVCVLLALLVLTTVPIAQSSRPRARDLGLSPGVFVPGALNAITDVPGVRVGHVTRVEGDHIRTGVTIIVPHEGNLFRQKVPGAVFVGNAFGKLAGSTQVDELGTIETPIALTNTLAVGAVTEGLVRWTLAQQGNADVRSVNALVGETNDGGLNDIRGLHVRPEDVSTAIASASAGPVEEGSVGAGTGTQVFGWKGGIGTSSRRLRSEHGGYVLGVLVQSNFGGVLTMGGAPIGRAHGRYAYAEGPDAAAAADGSCMIVVATDAPIEGRDLKRLAARALFGLARTGSSFSHGSGDFAIAFSAARSLRVGANEPGDTRRSSPAAETLSALFQAALETTEEAVYNSLLRATTVSSRFGSAEAIPIDRVRNVLEQFGVKPLR